MSGSSAKKRRKQAARSGRDWSALDRLMFADDVDWIYSLASQIRDPDVQGIVGNASLLHFSRVTYEGLQLLRRQRPSDHRQIGLKYSTEIAAARHAVKLLDDTMKTIESVEDEFRNIDLEHVNAFGDLISVMTIDGRPVVSSRVVSYQSTLALDTHRKAKEDNSYYQLSYEMGSTCSDISRRFGHLPKSWPLDSSALVSGNSINDIKRPEYYEARYGVSLPLEIGDILMAVESSINTALTVFQTTQVTFESSTFRARFVAFTHACSAIEQILFRHPSVHGAGTFSTVLGSAPVQGLLALRKLRNRCMHYGIPSELVGLDRDLPVYGLVEATSDFSFLELNEQMIDSLQRLSDTFAAAGRV